MGNLFISQLKDLEEDPSLSIELPRPRAGHSAALVGNPTDYLLIFGGAAEEILPGDFEVYKLKETINDMWVYHTG